MDGKAAGPFVPLQGQRQAAERRVVLLSQPSIGRPSWRGVAMSFVAWRVEREGARRQIEPRRLLPEDSEAEAYARAVVRDRQLVELTAEIGLRRPMRPRAACRPAAVCRARGPRCDQQVAVR